jgi:hypothetical protein
MGPVSEQDQAIKPGSPTRPLQERQAPQSFACGSGWAALPVSAPRRNNVLPAGVLKLSERCFQKADLSVEHADGVGLLSRNAGS